MKKKDLVQSIEIDKAAIKFIKDKNDKLIYEGDIIKHINIYANKTYEIIFEIEYKELYNCGCCADDSGIGFDFRGYEQKEIEIIGNIYENPELKES